MKDWLLSLVAAVSLVWLVIWTVRIFLEYWS